MLWTKDSDEVKYHYGYNLMKNHKLKKAKELFLKLKDNTYRVISPNLNSFLEKWKKDWESLNYARYASNYDDSFVKNQLWAYKKQAIFSSVNYISVGIYDAIYKKLGNNKYKIRFYQEYANNKKSDKGYKTLEVRCDTNQTKCKITKESWKKGTYQKAFILAPQIDQRLKDIKILEQRPVALQNVSKKKILLIS